MTSPVRGFSRSEKTGIAFLGFLLLWFLFNVYYQRASDKRVEAFSMEAGEVWASAGERIQRAYSIMDSLRGMHYMAVEPGSGELDEFVGQLRARAPFVTGFGKFDLVREDSRQAFLERMANSGLYDFRIRTFDETGQLVERQPSGISYPVSFVEPLNTSTLRLLGLDVSSDQSLNQQLLGNIETGQGFALTVNPDWPIQGDILYVEPVYLGHYEPTDAESRTRQFAGGYLQVLDVGSVLDIENIQPDWAMTVKLTSGGSTSVVEQRAGIFQIDRYFHTLSPQPTSEKTWKLGNSELHVQLSSRNGYSRTDLLAFAAFIVAGALAYVMFVGILYHRRINQYDQREHTEVLYVIREQAEKTLNAINDSVIALDRKYRLVHMNPAAEKLLGFKLIGNVNIMVSELVSLRKASDPNRPYDLLKAMQQLPAGQKLDLDILISEKMEDWQITKISLSHTLDLSGTPTGFILVLRDVSRERMLTRELEYQANHDSLTGANNRYYFENRLKALLEEQQGDEHDTLKTHGMIYMDLDQFKIINDTCGHAAGDRLLKDLSISLRSIIRKDDVLARLGGDEFGVIIVNANVDEARRVADRIYNFFQSYIFHHRLKAFSVRACLGFVMVDKSSISANELMSAADIACFTAKDSGRNMLCYYADNEEMIAKRHSEMNWLPRLQDALSGNMFQLLVQPISQIGPQYPGGRIHHFEFLLRLIDEKGRQITPFQFIQAAERYDLMRDIDRWVISNAIARIADLSEQVREEYSFSINISGQSAADNTFSEFIRTVIDQHDVNPSCLWFEITETAAITHFSVAQALFDDIREIGAKVALDDFGSGLSSFGYLKNLPVDVLKIDGQFVREITRNKVDREMVRALSAIAKSMELQTVAEFVENKEIVDVLIELEVDYAQGYYFGAPCTMQEAMAQCQSRNTG